MNAVKETRQGVGFPDWQIVKGAKRIFDWYNEDTVTELGFVDEHGRDVRLAVADHARVVIRSAYAGSDATVNLYEIPGLVRRFYGPATYGHTEWVVATD